MLLYYVIIFNDRWLLNFPIHTSAYNNRSHSAFLHHGGDDSDNKVNQRWRRVPLVTQETLVTADATR